MVLCRDFDPGWFRRRCGDFEDTYQKEIDPFTWRANCGRSLQQDPLEALADSKEFDRAGVLFRLAVVIGTLLCGC